MATDKGYDKLYFDNDMWHKKRDWIYYILGEREKENTFYVIATYSTLTKKLCIKQAQEFIPDSDFLKKFVLWATKYKEKQND